MDTSLSDNPTEYNTSEMSSEKIVSWLAQLSTEIDTLREENGRLHQHTHELVLHAGCYTAFSTGILLAFVINWYIR